MSCLNPSLAWISKPDALGSRHITFTSRFSPLSQKAEHMGESLIEIPCRKCVGCKLDYSVNWAVRCQLESLNSPFNFFVTLTYDDAHLPFTNHTVVDKISGEVLKDETVATLVPDHFKKFVKDLRAYFKYHFKESNIRFFGAGEYGSKNFRPHYHIILFNCNLRDLQLFRENFEGDNLYRSPMLEKIWNKGFVTVGACSFESCAYVARYSLKKIGVDKREYLERGVIPEFVRMSRRPGIGASYFEKNADFISKTDSIILNRGGKPISFKPSKYFEKFLTDEQLQLIKSKRILAADLSQISEMNGTNLSRDEYLKIKLNNKCNKSVTLHREL